MTIRILPQNLINQIAAGEVVERPSSAVKELVENAIDAGSSVILVDILEGGKDLIVVTENGAGMSKDQLALCIERHATSKIPDDDLSSISTMGFRGEALPSLGSISRLSITSRQKDQEHGWKMTIEAGIKSDLIPTSHPIGTRVEVKDLFFSTPARLKFLKTTNTERHHITDIIEKLALANPSLHFTLRDTKKTLLDFPQADSILERLTQIYGKEFKENTIEVFGERDGYKIEGFVGLPTYNRNAANYQQFFVNQRCIKDKILSHALRLSYQDLLAKDRYPVAILYLTIPAREVDVNVHPAKSEVRFLDAGLVRGLMVSSIKAALHSNGQQTARIVSDFALSKWVPEKEKNQIENESRDVFLQKTESKLNNLQNSYSFPKASQQSKPSNSVQESFSLNRFVSAAPNRKSEPQEIMHFPVKEPEIIETSGIVAERILGRPLAQLHLNYILSQTENGFLLIDQHAAAERIHYEKLKQDLESSKLKRQALLIPEILDLTCEEKEKLEPFRDELASYGLKIENFGEGGILIREIPAILGECDAKKLMRDILDEILTLEATLHLKEKIYEILSSYACHHSIRSGQKLSLSEMDHLLRDMEHTKFSGQCNHGRPTYIELSLLDIEKLFGRR